MSRSSSAYATDASSEYVDEAAYNVSMRPKLLMTNIDELLNDTEKYLKEQMGQMFIKPLRRGRKRGTEPVAALSDSMIDEWRQTVQGRINGVIKDNDVMRLLHALDDLETKASAKNPEKEAWRPSGSPKVDMKDYFLIHALEYRDQLKELSEEIRQELTVNETDIERGRKAVMDTDKELATMRKELNKKWRAVKTKTMPNEQIARSLDRFKRLQGTDAES